MTTIDPRQQLAAALQAQVAQVRRQKAVDRADPARAPARPDALALAQLVRAIDVNDPQRRQKAVRVFLESAFAREFGGDLLNDPAFPGMVDAVQAQMAGDAQTAAAVNALGDLLLAAGSP